MSECEASVEGLLELKVFGGEEGDGAISRAGYASVLRPGALLKEASPDIWHGFGSQLFFGSGSIR